MSVVAPELTCGLGGEAEAAPGVSADAAQRPASATTAATVIAPASLFALFTSVAQLYGPRKSVWHLVQMPRLSILRSLLLLLSVVPLPPPGQGTVEE